MEGEGAGEHFGEHGEGSGHVVWTSAMSTYMLTDLVSLVADGIKTSTGFKKVHHNMCARALNDHFRMRITREQVKNHLRTWKRRYGKINSLRRLSAAGWDEDNSMITLDHEHYANYVQDHKFDAEFLNKPLEHYKEMFTIFGNSMATGKFAKGSSEPLGTIDVKDENDDGDVHAAPSPTDDNGASSSAVRPNKRSRVVDNEEEGLVAAFKSNSEMLAKAIEKAAANDVPEDLLDKVQSIPGFDDTHKAYYYEHLVKNSREYMTMKQSRVLLETPSGFALFSVDEAVVKKPDDVWIHFRDAEAAECCMHTLGYVKIDNKSSAWKGKTSASKKLIALVKKFCKEGNQLYVNMELQHHIDELGVKSSLNYTLVGELIWGVKNVVHELVPHEKDNITKEYCLPLSNGLQKFLNDYCINLPPLFLAYLDISMEEVTHKLREYDWVIGNIGQRISNDLSYAKVLASILVPELLPEPAQKYDFSQMFSKELVSKIEEVRSSSTCYHEKRLTMKNRREIIGGLAHLLIIPLHMDKLITYVKAIESRLRLKIYLEWELELEDKSKSTSDLICGMEQEEEKREQEEQKREEVQGKGGAYKPLERGACKPLEGPRKGRGKLMRKGMRKGPGKARASKLIRQLPNLMGKTPQPEDLIKMFSQRSAYASDSLGIFRELVIESESETE